MGAPSLLVLAVLSLAPLLIEGLSHGALGFAESSRLGLALLVWLAGAGLPRAASEPADGGRIGCGDRWLVPAGFALPALALGAALDLAGGEARAHVAAAGLAGLVALLVLAAAAELGRGRRLYALFWLALVPGGALAAVALGWAPPLAGLEPPAWARATPLVWCHGWARAGGARAPAALVTPGVLGVFALLLGAGLAARRRPGGGP